MSTTDDLGDDLKITKTEGRKNVGGTWVSGSIAGHTFQVLVVANSDRGWDLEPTTDDAREIVDFLAAGIAEHTFGK